MRMQTTFKKLGGTYRQGGDYLLPNIEAPESPADWHLGSTAITVPSYQQKGAVHHHADG